MIQVTDEMLSAFVQAWHDADTERAGIAAILRVAIDQGIVTLPRAAEHCPAGFECARR